MVCGTINLYFLNICLHKDLINDAKYLVSIYHHLYQQWMIRLIHRTARMKCHLFLMFVPTKTHETYEKIRDFLPTCWSRCEFLRQSFCTRNDPERSEELLVVLSCYKETLQELQHSISSLFENTG